jgi:O-6-methylguanine DNA methyltransferase
MKKHVIETKEGAFTAWFSERGLARLDFPNGKTSLANKKEADSPQLRHWLKVTAKALGQVLAGREPQELPPLDLSEGTRFQVSVWKALSQIPAGQTRSYSEIAAAIGASRAVRAVGGACGENPIPVLIPCHRVLRKGGGLGGFSGGLPWKRRLLEIEHCEVEG